MKRMTFAILLSTGLLHAAACGGGEDAPDATMQYDAAVQDAVQHDAVQYDAVPHDAVQYDAGADAAQSNQARFELNVTLTGEAGTLTCAAAGVDTIKVTSRGAVVGDYVDLFDCDGGPYLTAPLPLDDYTVWIDALDASDELVAQSNSQLRTLNLDGETVTMNYSFPVDSGYLALTWNLVDDATSAAMTCAEAAAGGVEVISTPVGGGGAGLSDIFDCTDYQGVTAELPLDTYTVVVELFEQGTELSLGTSIPYAETLDYGNELIDLGNIEFQIQE